MTPMQRRRRFGNEREWTRNLRRIIHGEFGADITTEMLRATPAQISESVGITLGLWGDPTRTFAILKGLAPGESFNMVVNPFRIPNPCINVAYETDCKTLLGLVELACDGKWTHIKVESSQIQDTTEAAYLAAVHEVLQGLADEVSKLTKKPTAQ